MALTSAFKEQALAKTPSQRLPPAAGEAMFPHRQALAVLVTQCELEIEMTFEVKTWCLMDTSLEMTK